MNRSDRRRRLLLLSILAVFVVLFVVSICEEASARAGGGHSYSSGSRSSGGGYSSRSSGSRSSGSGSGGGEGLFILIRLVFHILFYYPLVGFPVLGFLIYFFYKASKSGENMYVNHVIKSASQFRQESNKRISLSNLQQKDPAFNESAFISRTENAFKIIQQAWTDRNLDSAQAFLSDGIFEQFSIQLKEMREKGIIDHMEKLEIKSAFPVHFETDKNFDVIHLRIDARAVNYRKNEKTGSIINGSTMPESFAEVWSFMRKPGAKTQNKPGLLEGQCPSCGNPIKIGRLSKCDVCNALLRSGEFDWVLTSITQACEWAIRPEKAVPGLEKISQTDPGFNMQHIRERVAVMFWRKIEAERTGKIDPLRKIARNEFCDAQTQWLKPDNAGSRRFFTSCAVGAISLLAVDPAEPDDSAFVEVIWSGIPSTQKGNDPLVAVGNPINFKHVFIIGRKHGAKTKLESSLAASHCPSCGAPEQQSTANECAYCGSVMNDGSSEWVLESVVDRNDAKVREIMSKISDQTQKKAASKSVSLNNQARSMAEATVEIYSGIEMVRWTIAMMLADGQIDTKEMEMIRDLARRKDISESRLQEIIAEIKSSGNPVDHVMATSPMQPDRNLLAQIARVALADGTLSNEEKAMLLKVGQKLQMTDPDINMLLTRERNAMYKEAKDLIKQNKK